MNPREETQHKKGAMEEILVFFQSIGNFASERIKSMKAFTKAGNFKSELLNEFKDYIGTFNIFPSTSKPSLKFNVEEADILEKSDDIDLVERRTNKKVLLGEDLIPVNKTFLLSKDGKNSIQIVETKDIELNTSGFNSLQKTDLFRVSSQFNSNSQPQPSPSFSFVKPHMSQSFPLENSSGKDPINIEEEGFKSPYKSPLNPALFAPIKTKTQTAYKFKKRSSQGKSLITRLSLVKIDKEKEEQQNKEFEKCLSEKKLDDLLPQMENGNFVFSQELAELKKKKEDDGEEHFYSIDGGSTDSSDDTDDSLEYQVTEHSSNESSNLGSYEFEWVAETDKKAKDLDFGSFFKKMKRKEEDQSYNCGNENLNPNERFASFNNPSFFESVAKNLHADKENSNSQNTANFGWLGGESSSKPAWNLFKSIPFGSQEIESSKMNATCANNNTYFSKGLFHASAKKNGQLQSPYNKPGFSGAKYKSPITGAGGKQNINSGNKLFQSKENLRKILLCNNKPVPEWAAEKEVLLENFEKVNKKVNPHLIFGHFHIENLDMMEIFDNTNPEKFLERGSSANWRNEMFTPDSICNMSNNSRTPKREHSNLEHKSIDQARKKWDFSKI